MYKMPAALIVVVSVVAFNNADACTPFTGSCGGPGQISCSAANAGYRACLEAEKNAGKCPNCGPTNLSPDSPKIDQTTRTPKSTSAR